MKVRNLEKKASKKQINLNYKKVEQLRQCEVILILARVMILKSVSSKFKVKLKEKEITDNTTLSN